MTLRELRERQEQLVAEAREQIDGITDDMPESEIAERNAKFDEIMAEHDKVGEQITRQERADAAAAALEQPVDRRSGTDDIETAAGGNGNENQDEARQAAFERWFRFGMSSLDNEQRTMMAELRGLLPEEVRAQSVGTDSAGGYTVPQGFMPELVRSMAAWGPMLDPGITRELVTGTGNQLEIPTVDDTGNEGVLVTENTQHNEQDVTFGQKLLDAYLYSSKIVRVSVQLLQDSAFDMNGILRDLFAERLGRIGNRQLTTGTGSSQPNGIVTASGAGATAAAAAAIAFDDMIELQHSIDPAYRGAPNVRWMFNDTTLKLLRKLKDGDNNYIWQPANAAANAPASILGDPYTVNQHMPDVDGAQKSVLYGDFNKYWVRRVRDFTLLRLVERYADYLQVGFIAFMRIDGELSDTAAVKHLIHPSA